MFIKIKIILVFIVFLTFCYGVNSYIQFMKEEYYVIVFNNSGSIIQDKQMDKYRATISEYGLTIINESSTGVVFEVKSSLKKARKFKNDYRSIIKFMTNSQIYYNLESRGGVVCPDGLEIAKDYKSCT